MEFLKNLSLRVKLIIGSIVGIISFVLYLFVRQKIRARDKMEYELNKVKSEINLTHLEKDSKEKKIKLQQLEKEEKLIREKIKFIEEKEVAEKRDVSLEELDAFFDKRGF